MGRSTAGTAASNRGARLWIGLGTGIGVALMLAWITWLFWPTWEDRHKDEVRALLAQAGEAMSRKDIRTAYDCYDRAVSMTDGKIDAGSSVLASQIAAAHQNRDKLLPQVSAQLEQERRAREAADRAAQAERQRVEAVKRATEQHAAAEKLERERAARRAATAEAARQAEAVRIERIRSSEAFAATIRDAEQIYQQTLTGFIDEDSAYRVISLWADADAKLLAVLARQQALIRGKPVASRLDAIERRHTTANAAADSAIRAAYIHDRAALDYVGVLARVWTNESDRNNQLASEQARIASDIARRLVADDSAPRAVSAYNDGLLRAWAALANAREQDVASIVTATNLENAADDSSWRVADRLAEAQTRVVLTLVRQDWPERANAIENAMQLTDITETSALRALGNKKRAMAEGLVALIAHQIR